MPDTIHFVKNSKQTAGERRLRRSHDPITALHYQLAETRRTAALDAVVLVDDSGCLVAGAGAWPVCEELAAYAPLLEGSAPVRSVVSHRIASLAGHVERLLLDIDGQPAILCGRGGSAGRSAALERARAGVLRILAA
jgi:hypothetical protein